MVMERSVFQLSVFTVLVLVGVINILNTDWNQWTLRPSIECEYGEAVHRYAKVNATRVNIRDLPTVFSNVLTQKSAPERVVVICEFGVWSQIDQIDVGPITWISSGLITPLDSQPLTDRMKLVYFVLLVVGTLGLLIALYRPQWISTVLDLLLQTQELPEHAKPLISTTPRYHPARDAER